jgi:hypothetical protein
MCGCSVCNLYAKPLLVNPLLVTRWSWQDCCGIVTPAKYFGGLQGDVFAAHKKFDEQVSLVTFVFTFVTFVLTLVTFVLTNYVDRDA